jgi:hypothetical protein
MDRSARVRSFALVVAAAGLLAGCGGSSSGGGEPVAAGGGDTTASTTPTTAASSLFPDDFESVCQGATQSQATAYDKKAATHKALYFETYEEDLLDQSTTDLPGDWTIQWSADDPAALSGIDIVACGVRTSSKHVKTCTGYKDNDDKELGKLELYTAKYELSVHEATTGKTLSTTTVSTNDTDCPAFASFDSGEDTTVDYNSIPKDKVVAALKPFIQPKS